MYKLSFYVPESHLTQVKEAMFAAGAGNIGGYEACAWQTLGEGQFRPLPGSNPAFGEQGKLAYSPEYLVEMVCDDEYLEAVISALKQAHPYETPAFSAWQVIGA